MGEVFRARDTKLYRDVALKVLLDEFASDPERFARFQREGQVCSCSLNRYNERMIVKPLSPKEQVIQLIQDQPDDSSFDQILRELAFARMVDRGLADSDASRTVDHDEMKRIIESWQK